MWLRHCTDSLKGSRSYEDDYTHNSICIITSEITSPTRLQIYSSPPTLTTTLLLSSPQPHLPRNRLLPDPIPINPPINPLQHHCTRRHRHRTPRKQYRPPHRGQHLKQRVRIPPILCVAHLHPHPITEREHGTHAHGGKRTDGPRRREEEEVYCQHYGGNGVETEIGPWVEDDPVWHDEGFVDLVSERVC